MNLKQTLKSRLRRNGLSLRFISRKRRAELLGMEHIRNNDVFMCSYPRSGNTWTRMIVACILSPELASVDLSIIESLVPDAGSLPTLPVSVRVFKEHRPSFDVFPRVIYNVRDGRDAVSSALDYARKVLGFRGSMLDFVLNRDAQVFGLWNEHVDAAIRFSAEFPDDFLLLRFEDMKSDPRSSIRRIASFLKCPITEERIDQIAKITNIENVVKPNESCDDPRYKHTLGKGDVGRWKQSFGELELKLFEGVAGQTLDRLGYPRVIERH